MLTISRNKYKSVLHILLIGLGFILIRAFENTLFYDPFLAYYRSEFIHKPIPNVNPVFLFLSYGFRYYLNMALSLALLYVLFKDKQIIKFSLFLYFVIASVLMIAFFFVLQFFAEDQKMTLFYIRRFIIHPVFILLFIPAFYYQKKSKYNLNI